MLKWFGYSGGVEAVKAMETKRVVQQDLWAHACEPGYTAMFMTLWLVVFFSV